MQRSDNKTTQNRQTSTPPAVFDSAIPGSERPQTNALDSAATGIGCFSLHIYLFIYIYLYTYICLIKSWQVINDTYPKRCKLGWRPYSIFLKINHIIPSTPVFTRLLRSVPPNYCLNFLFIPRMQHDPPIFSSFILRTKDLSRICPSPRHYSRTS